MAIWELFSKREKKRKGELPDVYQYDNIPEALRGQIAHVVRDAVGRCRIEQSYTVDFPHPPNQYWNAIYKVIIREKGWFILSEKYSNSPPDTQCIDHLMTSSTEDVLDLVEVIFAYINGPIQEMHPDERRHHGIGDPVLAVNELNGRFREHGVGYELAGNKIVRIDSEYIHNEAIKPALSLLHRAGKRFSGPLDEFLDAHEKYRKGEHKDSIVAAAKAFESTMKAICKARKWDFDPHKDTASTLLKIVFDNELVPAWMQSQFTALRAVLEAGLPTVRNKTSGHGQGAVPTDVPEYYARYALNLAASNIVFLIEAHNATK
jgi:Domain of unknown function (DUF7014)/AbiJ N-terminal domain 4